MTMKFIGGQREPVYSAMLNNIAYANQNGILSGCEVSASSPAAMTIDVTSGTIFFGNDTIDVVASTDTLAIDTEASANTRIDLILTNNTGTLSVLKGTASAIPATPNYEPDNYIVLALITVTNITTTITSAEINDTRILNQGGAGGSGGTFGRHLELFTAQTSVTVTHNLGDDEPNVFVYNSSNELIIPEEVTVVDTNSITVDFTTATSGKIVVYGGAGVNNAYYTEEYVSSLTWSVVHNLDNKYVNITCFDSSDKVIEPQDIELTDENNLVVTWGIATVGRVLVTGGITTNRWGSGDNTFPIQGDEVMNASDINKAYYQNEEGATLNHASVNVTNTATLILAANTSRKTILIQNIGSEDCFLADSASVTISNGFPVKSGESIFMYNKDAIYGITSSGTVDIRYMEAQ